MAVHVELVGAGGGVVRVAGGEDDTEGDVGGGAVGVVGNPLLGWNVGLLVSDDGGSLGRLGAVIVGVAVGVPPLAAMSDFVGSFTFLTPLR